MQILKEKQNLSDLSEKFPHFVRMIEKSSNFWEEVSDLRARIRFRTLSSELENTETELQVRNLTQNLRFPRKLFMKKWFCLLS
jgi:hypothetical protein